MREISLAKPLRRLRRPSETLRVLSRFPTEEERPCECVSRFGVEEDRGEIVLCLKCGSKYLTHELKQFVEWSPNRQSKVVEFVGLLYRLEDGEEVVVERREKR